ncbi:hypothetical protein GGF40_002930 [Coemansia sp. RSA 1286]|nr:hypothetical protein IWW45_008680 [Coemansia sp. RSA 485]KAJ2597922.1 hypothetical protein GGF39_002847 [Coemansia sp. RSA 1721]KAJ2636565.1 hypothetical protein GGF40_002930 [Coemansia sp. RSA 1286]
MSLYNRERVVATLDSMLAQHSRGLETTIYADDAMLQTINSSVTGGLSGLLLRKNKISARNVRRLGEASESPGLLGLADGPHILFLLGDVSWMGAETWAAMESALSSGTASSCTLCVAVPEQLWGESLALASNVGGGLRAPVTETSVCAALKRLAGRREFECSVHTHGAMAMALPGNQFAMPLGAGPSAQSVLARRQSEWMDAERAALGLVSLIHELRLDTQFYSLGSGAARRVARRSAAMPRVSNGHLATVVVLDRAADMAASVRHGGNVLDELLRAMESTGTSQELLLARLCQSAEIGDKLAALEDRRKAEILVGQSDDLRQMWSEVQEIAANCRWRETQAAEKTLALVLASENDADAAWDFVLTAIPQLSQEMVPDPVTHTGSVNDISRILATNTPAPGMLVMAASILSYRRMGFPQTQRALALRRLAADYAVVAGYSTEDSHLLEAGSDAWRWASWLVERVAALAEGKEQFGTAVGSDLESPYAPLFPRIAADIASGRPVLCAQLELAEHGGTAGTAASLLKGLGRRFLSHRTSPGSPEGPGDTFSSQLSPRLGGSNNPGSNASLHHRAEDVVAATASSDAVVFFVVGGLSFEEAAAMARATANMRQRVFIGSTGLSSAASLLLITKD